MAPPTRSAFLSGGMSNLGLDDRDNRNGQTNAKSLQSTEVQLLELVINLRRSVGVRSSGKVTGGLPFHL